MTLQKTELRVHFAMKHRVTFFWPVLESRMLGIEMQAQKVKGLDEV
jgi:hypothetical protein